MKHLITFLIFISLSLNLTALEKLPKNITLDEVTYVVKLNNGDLFTGEVTEFIFDDQNNEGIKLSTDIGIAPIYAQQIKFIIPFDEYYKHDNRVFLLPSAYPISDNHYLGAYELLFFNLGVGITDYISITVGKTLVPFLYEGQQLSNLNIKATLINFDWNNEPGGMAVALASNMAFLNDNNTFINVLGIVSFKMKKSIFTTSLIYKAGNNDFNEISVRDEIFNVNYENGSMGIGLGIDNRFTNWLDLHFIGEVWNGNITKPSNTGVLLGLRYTNEVFSTDFGISFFTTGVFAPFASFVWTPF